MIISACIVDDSQQDAKLVQEWLQAHSINGLHFSSIAILSSAETVPDSDLYFLDIGMPEMNGFQVIDRILSLHKDASVIFISQHDELVYESLRYNSVFFIRKSHLDIDMPDALQKYLQQNQFKNQTYTILLNKELFSIPLSRIYYFEVYRNDMILHTDKEKFKYRATLKSVIAKMPSQLFVQTHKSYLVNLSHTAACLQEGLILDDNRRIPISRRNWNTVFQQYHNYLMTKG